MRETQSKSVHHDGDFISDKTYWRKLDKTLLFHFMNTIFHLERRQIPRINNIEGKTLTPRSLVWFIL